MLSEQGQHLGTIPVKCPPADCQNLAFAEQRRRCISAAPNRSTKWKPSPADSPAGQGEIVWIPVRV